MRTFVLLGALLCAAVSAGAGTTVYGNLADFQAATSGNIVLDFNAAPAGNIAGNEFHASGFDFAAVPGHQLNIGTPDFFWGSNYLNIDAPPFQCCSDNWDSLNVYITGNHQAFALNIVDSWLPGAGEYIDVFDQSDNLLLHYTGPALLTCDPGGCDSFFSVVADVNIGRIFISENPDDVDDVGYDDFQLANVRGQVPEPGSMLLFGSGLLAVAGIVRRRLS